MPRILAALLLGLIVGVLVAPDPARALGHDHAGHRTVAATEAATPVARPSSGAMAEKPQTSVVAAAIAPRSSTPACDRDCDHASGMSGCLCMAACAAAALPDLPMLVPHPVRAARPSGESPIWRAITRGPPTPPPRA